MPTDSTKKPREDGLRPLKKSAARNIGHRCNHSWYYEQTIYGTGDGDDGLAIHRQCRECGVHELCKIRRPAFSRNTRGFELPDLRGK